MDVNTAMGLIRLVVWIWLSSLVARYVQRRGGSFGKYLAFSILVWSKYSIGRFSARSRMMYGHHAK
jgi:hypothetical protein